MGTKKGVRNLPHHFPLDQAYLCENCQSVGNRATRCAACDSDHIMSLGRILGRTSSGTESVEPIVFRLPGPPKLLQAFFAALLLLAAPFCRAQLPTVAGYICPTPTYDANNNLQNYSVIKAIAALQYIDVNSPTNPLVPGEWCYVVETYTINTGTFSACDGKNIYCSVPSNTTLADVLSSNHQVTLDWDAPAPSAQFSCPTPSCNYVVARTEALPVFPIAPSMVTVTLAP